MRLFPVFVLVVCAAQSAVAQQPDSVHTADAYLDATAQELVRLARERRQVADLSVERYKVLSKERISVGLRGIRRDRLLYRREVAGRLEWTRSGTARVEVLGAREAIPVAVKGVQLPSDLGSFMPHLAFDPADNRMLIGWDEGEFVRHPLAPNSEQFYQFRTGSTTTIHLPDGRTVRLIELEIIPRQTDPHNIRGSFFLDAQTHAVVQASFRLARDIDILRDLEDEDDDDIPRFLRPLKAGVDYVSIQYGLYDLKWWMPHLVAFEGVVRVGFLRMPLRYERTYAGYEIEGRELPVNMPMAELLQRDSIARAERDSCRQRVRVQIRVGGRDERAAADKIATTQCGRWQVTVPTDTAALLASPELPENAFAAGEELMTDHELRELAKRIEKLDGGPAVLPEAVTDFGLLSARNARYNRVEGLSLAAHGELDWGAFRLSGLGRLGVADLEPNFELALHKPGAANDVTLNAYRRLNGFDPNARPFSLGSSLSALLFGVDDADYYRSIGVELRAEPSGAASRWYTARIFAQKESAAAKETDFSLRHVFNDAYAFRANLTADRATEYGGELTLRASRGLDPEGFRFGLDAYGHGAAGTYDFARGALTLRATVPLPGALSGALEAASGLVSDKAPLQHQWYLGGTNSLRGYRAGVLSGAAFWRGRAEIGYGLPAVRLVGFGDIGWAGDRADFTTGRPLLSVGAGTSFLDGIVRFDVARGLRAPTGWTAMLYFDAAL